MPTPEKAIPIMCAECEATIVVTPDMLDGAYACEQCGAAIDFALYEPLEAMIEERERVRRTEREHADAAKKRARDKQREAERAEAERVRHERAIQKEAEKLKAHEHAKHHREQESRLKEELEKQQRASLRIGTGGADILCILSVVAGLALGLIGIGILISGESAIHEIEGGIAMLLGSVCFFAGIIVNVVTNHARALALKLDAVRDAIQDAAKSHRSQ